MIKGETFLNLNKVAWGRGHNNDPMYKENIGFGYIHYAFIKNLRPDRVLCVGSQKGYIPAICALACKHNGHGKVDFVDAGYSQDDPDDEHSWGGIGLWRDTTNKYFDDVEMGLSDFIDLHVTTTKEFVQKYFDNKETYKYSYAHIDGDHSLEGVTRDYKLVYNLIEKGGFMTFHDVQVNKGTKWGRCGVKQFWHKEPYTKSVGFEKLTIPLDCGLGILRKL